jgi:flagellar assembly protein FliH
MSLSRFYKTNEGFQKKAILKNSTNAGKEPVWESIVKEKNILPEPVDSDILDTAAIPEPPPDTILDNQDFDDSPVPDDSPEAENIVREKPPPAPVPPPEPSIDVEGIRENAFTAGVTAGRKQAEEDFENSAQTLLSICNELNRLRETILQNSVGEMKELVLAISEKIIRHSVTEQNETIVATIKDAIHLAVKSDEFQIQLNPDDLKAVESQKKEIIDSISGLDNIVFKSDATVERGGCTLESTCCTVDASMTCQIKVIHDSVMAEQKNR